MIQLKSNYLIRLSILLLTFVYSSLIFANSPQGTFNLSIIETLPVKCNGGTGKIKGVVTVTSGTVTGITYKWSPGNLTTQEISSTAGTYTLTVTTSNSGSKTATIVVSEPDPLNIRFFVESIGCNNGNGSALFVDLEGGIKPYKVQIINPNTQAVVAEKVGVNNSSTSVSCPAGTYKYRIVDANLCSRTPSETFKIYTTSKPFNNPGISIDPVKCFNGTGKLKLTPEQIVIGLTNVKFDIKISKNGQLIFFDNNITSTPDIVVGAGTYDMEVDFASNCLCNPIEQSITISEPAQLTNSGTITDVDCFGNSTGKIVNNTSGGNGGYKYTWSNGKTSKDLINERAGVYLVTVTDSKNCQANPASHTFEIKQPSQLSNSGVVTDADCFNSASGDIINTTSGGNGGYLYAWSNGKTTKDLINERAGTYVVTVTDSKNCKTNPVSQSYVIKEPPLLDINSSISHVKCFGGSDGKIEITPKGGNGGYVFNWSNGSTSNTINQLFADTYKLSLTDLKNCKTNPEVIEFRVKQPEKLSNSNSVVKDVNCFAQKDGEITQSISGGTAPYSYLWNDGKTSADRIGLGIGQFSCKITDVNGCLDNFVYTVFGPPELIQRERRIVPETNNSKGSIEIDVSGGTFPYKYSWTGPNGFRAFSKDIGGLSKGEYTLSLTDENGCVVTSKYSVPFITGVNDILFSNFGMYYNAGKIRLFNLPENVECKVDLFDLRGVLIQSQSIATTDSNYDMFVPDLASGIYIFKINLKGLHRSFKMVIH